MSDSGENKYKWTPESSTLLVSVWTDKQVQKQLENSSKPLLIWDSVAKYMNKKGYNVNGKQCRSRMKQVLVCYREAKRSGTRAGVEQYYESIDRVLKVKRLEHLNNNGIDTVDSTTNIKSPPKEVKTNKNLQMRQSYKYQQPPESIYRTEALSPIWSGGRDEDYPDSPESNETVLAQPLRVLSPVRDAATNTIQQQLGTMNRKIMYQNGICEEVPIKETFRQNNYFSEIPFQNTVQNVQNQIIQENMQQNQAILQQNLLQNQLLEHNRLQSNPVLRQNVQNINQGLYTDNGIPYNQWQIGFTQDVMTENAVRSQNKYPLNSVNNRAVPQEPRRHAFRQNLAASYRQFQDIPPNHNPNLNHFGLLSPSISPDIPPCLNDAFCQSKNDKMHPLNETFTQTSSNMLNSANVDMTTITNNATFNDDSISIEFLQDSPSPDTQPVKVKDFAVNTDIVPHAPLRKKKAEKLEQLMMNAINSQNEVVNKILSAQSDMMTRVLDLDRDRQNRLENRLDHLLDVVQTAVLNKSSEKSSDNSVSLPEPLITNLVPPPKPGVIPPKLDLVPPKPCRVPCTVSNTNCQPVNQNPIVTKPGVISPVISPSKRVGAIWQKLGPVSTSPFVRAQQQLGFRPVHAVNNDLRMQSSAERRLTKEFEGTLHPKAIMFETVNFLNAERHIQEEVENARIKNKMDQDLQNRKGFFSQREPNAAMILTAAFLDAEIQSTEIIENARLNWLRQMQKDSDREILNKQYNRHKYDAYNSNNNNDFIKPRDEIALAGQGSSYEHLREINMGERVIGNPSDSSTPFKGAGQRHNSEHVETDAPRQTIQQLAQLVMNSARWRNNPVHNQQLQHKDLNLQPSAGIKQKPTFSNEDAVILRNDAKDTVIDNFIQYKNKQSHPSVDSKAKTEDWLQDRYSYGAQITSNNNVALNEGNQFPKGPPKPPRPMGFTTEFLKNEENNNHRRQNSADQEKRVGFVQDNAIVIDDNKRNRFVQEEDDPFHELQQLYIQKQCKFYQSKGLPFIVHNGKVILAQNEMIERYIQDLNPINKGEHDTDSDNNEEYLDTTASMPTSRKNSFTSVGTKSTKSETACIIS